MNKIKNIFVAVAILIFLVYYFNFVYTSGIVKRELNCPEGVIPERILLNENGRIQPVINEHGVTMMRTNEEWADGTKMLFGYTCQKGYREGQNTNYYYCDKWEYKLYEVSDSGEVIKNEYIKIYLVLDSNNQNSEGYKVVESTCKTS